MNSPASSDLHPTGLTRTDLPSLGDRPEESRLDVRGLWSAARQSLPVELEIGSGKGTFLVQQATQHPEVNYLGIEWAREYWLHAADRCRRHHLENVRVLHDDASEFVSWRAPDQIFSQAHVYFPDPWPKKRHHKRRLVQESFLREMHRALTEHGVLRLVTDHSDYFEWMNEHADCVTDLFERVAFERPGSGAEGEIVGTNFERKYRREGRPFNAMALRKR